MQVSQITDKKATNSFISLLWNNEFWDPFLIPMVLGSNTYGIRLQKHRF